MRRTIAVYSVPAAVTAVAWMRLESPRRGGDAVWMVLLAVVPALAPTLRLRLAAAVPVALLASWVALDGSPLHPRELSRTAKHGFLQFYDVQVPFGADAFPHMHGVLLLAVFLFCLVLALAIAARRPFAAVLAMLVGAGWPATLLTSGRDLDLGAAILLAALWILAALRARNPRALVPAAVAGTVLVAAAFAAAGSGTVAKGALLGWQRWDLYDLPDQPVSVGYVWDAQYGGIRFPAKKTVVLRIKAPPKALYWRATTLDAFAQDHWFESLYPLADRPAFDPQVTDPLTPRPKRRDLVRQDVEVVGLRDARLVAAASPVRFATRGVGSVYVLDGGVARAATVIRTGESYTAWSAVPRPTPDQLSRVRPDYPSLLGPDLDVDPSTRMIAFGQPGQAEQRREIFSETRTQQLWPYRPLVDAALRVTRGARSPYEAVVELESWFRSTGGFRYDEQPVQTRGVPPLVDFVTRTKAGYCQHFAGAMALMLRYLGIPARVAVGFTSGTYRHGAWTVTDHDAHAWVEVWFKGYGWLPFDPTPGRGTLSGRYTIASDAADAIAAINRAVLRNHGGDTSGAGGRRFLPDESAQPSLPGHGHPFLRLLALALAAVLLGIGLLKLAVRRARYLRRDPRLRAAAARRELADFLRDQGHVVAASATLEDLHELVGRELGVSARRFVSAAGAARWGPPAEAEYELRRARRELRALLHAIRRQLTRSERTRGWLALRSLRA